MSAVLRRLPPTAAPAPLTDILAALHARAGATEAFSAALSEYLGATACCTAASGRAALFLLLREMARRAGPRRTEVVMPAYTCPALAKVTLDAGLRPRLVDVTPETLGMDARELGAACGPHTLAVIHVHPFGLPLDMGPARAAAQAAGAALIEDAAQAMGARVAGSGTRAGTTGDFGLFSLGPGKALSAGGGGAACAPDDENAALLRAAWAGLRTAPASPAGVQLAALNAAFHPAGWALATRLGALRFGESEAGLSYRVAGLPAGAAEAAIRGLTRLDAANAARRRTAGRLLGALAGVDGLILPAASPGSEPIYLRLPVLLPDESARDALYAQLVRAGLGAGPHVRTHAGRAIPGSERSLSRRGGRRSPAAHAADARLRHGDERGTDRSGVPQHGWRPGPNLGAMRMRTPRQ